MTWKIINRMIEYFGQDAKRINHALKVYGFAKAISGRETLSYEQRLCLEIAAVLHDIGIKEAERKYSSASGKYQELEGPPIAAEILKSEEIDEKIADRVCYLVGNHHSYGKIDGLDFQILVEADFLVNIHEDALDVQAVGSIKSKYFMTAGGREIIKSLYNA